MRTLLLTAIAATTVAGASHAATYDFLAEANTTGQIGEAIFETFNTSDNGVFVGPNLSVTATKKDDNGVVQDAFVYFDAGNAGMGVCGAGFLDSNKAAGSTGTYKVGDYNAGSGANLCNPGSDDGLTTAEETLHFEATEAVNITAFLINSNHDGDSILDTIWEIGDTVYDVSSGDPAIDISGVNDDPNIRSQGSIIISGLWSLSAGETLNFAGISGANSYISAVSVSAVPLPAAAWMLIAGVGGLGALRRRQTKS